MESDLTVGSEHDIATDPPSTIPANLDESGEDDKQVGEAFNNSSNQKGETESEAEPEHQSTVLAECKDILKAMEVVERDSMAIAQSFTSVFASLRVALSQVTTSSIDHMDCFSDAAGRLQESVLDASTKGNRYINSCLRLNEEMKGMESLASHLKLLRRNADALDSAVNRMLRPP